MQSLLRSIPHATTKKYGLQVLRVSFHTSSVLYSKKPTPPSKSTSQTLEQAQKPIKSLQTTPSQPTAASQKQDQNKPEPKSPPKPNATSKSPVLINPKPNPMKIEILEKDLEEKFILGTGPGGQAVNKTSNTVFLKHIPTGTIVKCGQTRSRAENRHIARKIMRDKLDQMVNGKLKIELRREKIRRNKSRRKRRAAAGKEEKEDEDEEEDDEDGDGK